MTSVSGLLQNEGQKAGKPSEANQTAFKLHPGLIAAAPTPSVTTQNAAAITPAGQMFSAPHAASFTTAQRVEPGLGQPHQQNGSGYPHNTHVALGQSGSNIPSDVPLLDGQSLADMQTTPTGSLASPGGSLQSDISSASALYRRLRSSKQGMTQPGSQGPPGSLDSAQSSRVAEQLSAVRMSNAHAHAAFGAGQHASPMEGVVPSGPAFNDPQMMASPFSAAAMATGNGSQRLNETGRQPGGFMPGASGKAFVAEPSSSQMLNPPAAHAVCTHYRFAISHDLTAFFTCFVKSFPEVAADLTGCTWDEQVGFQSLRLLQCHESTINGCCLEWMNASIFHTREAAFSLRATTT